MKLLTPQLTRGIFRCGKADEERASFKLTLDINEPMTNNNVRFAPGGPGIEPRWTRGNKVAVGTAYSTSSRIWYTLDHGSVTEVYYPTIDSPQIRDLQFLVTDGETFFHDERRNFVGEIDCVSEAALGFEVLNREKEGRYSLHKTV